MRQIKCSLIKFRQRDLNRLCSPNLYLVAFSRTLHQEKISVRSASDRSWPPSARGNGAWLGRMQTGVALRRRGQGQSPGVWMITTATACWFPQSCCRSWRGLCSEESNQLQFCLPDSEDSSESPHAPGGSREPVMPVISKMPPAWFPPICSLYSRLTVTSQWGWVRTPLRHCKIIDKEWKPDTAKPAWSLSSGLRYLQKRTPSQNILDLYSCSHPGIKKSKAISPS